MSDTAAETYSPFPAFEGWAGGFDPAAADAFAARLPERRTEMSETDMERAVEVATRYAAVDTGAIEGLYETNRGFTRTIATQSAAWEAALKMRGDEVARSIQDALNGYNYVLDAATKRVTISEVWIRQLHEILCASQETYTVYTEVRRQRQPLPKGRYKTMPNSPTNADTGRRHHYAPVDDTPAEMERLVHQLRSPEFAQAHPVVQAAYAHYAFVSVHPFANGNGRVARALASAFLYRSPGVPLVVFADQKDVYIDALEAADTGRAGPFVAFVEQRVLDAVELVLGSLRHTIASVDSAVRALREEVRDENQLTPSEIEALTYRLTDVVTTHLATTVQGVDQTVGVILTVRGHASGRSVAPDGYRAGDLRETALETEFRSGIEVERDVRVHVWVSAGGSELHFLVTASDQVDPLEVRLRDIHPQATQLLDIKVAAWVESVVATEIDLLRQQIAAAGQA